MFVSLSMLQEMVNKDEYIRSSWTRMPNICTKDI